MAIDTEFHSNGWTVFVNENINALSVSQLHEVCKMVVSNMVVVFKNQTLTPDDELRICSAIGKYQVIPETHERFKHIRVNEGILRVTGQKNQYGEEGLFGHRAALDWHANQPSNIERKPLIWLYGIQGTTGSRTSWINNVMSYNDLDDKVKHDIATIKLILGYQSGRYSNSKFFHDHINKQNPIPLVHTNEAGMTGLFFPFLQIFGFDGVDNDRYEAVMAHLRNHILQEKYMYHHDWSDGDIVISEQWLSIHKRWEFEGMADRVLHRIAFDYSKVYP